MHKLSAAAARVSALTALRSVDLNDLLVDLLDVLHEYACGGLPSKPCQAGARAALRRHLMHNEG